MVCGSAKVDADTELGANSSGGAVGKNISEVMHLITVTQMVQSDFTGWFSLHVHLLLGCGLMLMAVCDLNSGWT